MERINTKEAAVQVENAMKQLLSSYTPEILSVTQHGNYDDSLGRIDYLI